MKRCPKCSQTKALDSFHRHKNRPDGLTGWCKSCCVISNRNWQRRNPRARRDYHCRHFYGLEPKDVELMFLCQKGRCAICSAKLLRGKTLAIDHCHKTHRVRGLLCRQCNLGLGAFLDSTALLTKAIKYLNIKITIWS